VNAATWRSTTPDPVESYAAVASRFAATVTWSDLRAPVASCPGWSTYDLVVHLGNVHAWAATIVETGRPAVEQNDEPRSSSRGRIVSEWYVGKAEDLYQVLRHSSPDAPCWNFAFGSGTAGFWHRRQLHETTVHQVDLDVAQGRESELDPEVSADGVDEVLTVMAHRMHQRGHAAALERPVALTATDTGDAWVVAPRPSAPSVERRRSARVGVEDRVEARADVLYRLLWHRPVESGQVRISGDEARVRAFLASRLTP
jgi:uncharacterized protein (TIGR03083 family)